MYIYENMEDINTFLLSSCPTIALRSSLCCFPIKERAKERAKGKAKERLESLETRLIDTMKYCTKK